MIGVSQLWIALNALPGSSLSLPFTQHSDYLSLNQWGGVFAWIVLLILLIDAATRLTRRSLRRAKSI